MKFLRVLCVLCSLFLPASALDREAFAFTSYNLNVRIEPSQQRIGVRGRITLRNDSASAQKNVVLQISSTLDWKSVQLDGKPVQFFTQQYASDIDHTGALSEAIVTLPHEVPSKGTLELDIGYEGVIPLDSTRLTRIGIPADKAKHSDWDQIGKTFTAVRGIGYVAWYPIATEAASLSEGNSVPETVGRWKVKHADTTMDAQFESTSPDPIFFSGTRSMALVNTASDIAKTASFNMARPGVSVPTFVIADYQKLPPRDFLDIEFLSGQEDAAKDCADVASQIDPIVPVGRGTRNLQILGLPDLDALSFVTQGMLLIPLKPDLTNQAELDIVYALARQLVLSPRAWIQDGLAHYAQAEFIETQKGRQAALDYLSAHRAALAEAEKPNILESTHSLINAPDDFYLQVKSMYVWWMLKDMLGNLPREALLDYNAGDDKDPAYMQRLMEKRYHVDWQWFFDDWVYHDRGLPDFRVESVFYRPMDSGGFLVTITVENLGSAGAEVPVSLEMESGEIRRRLQVRAKSKASLRIEAVSAPKLVTVNDGSVPESDMSNNTYRIESLNH